MCMTQKGGSNLSSYFTAVGSCLSMKGLRPWRLRLGTGQGRVERCWDQAVRVAASPCEVKWSLREWKRAGASPGQDQLLASGDPLEIIQKHFQEVGRENLEN